MKKAICLIFLTANFYATHAQSGNTPTKGFKCSVGATLAIAADNLPLWGAGPGLDVSVQYGLTEKFALTADAGLHILFSVKGIGAYRIIPVRAGIRYYPKEKFYLAAKTGVGFLKVKNVEGATALAYAIGGGYMINKKFDLGLAYDGYSKNGTIGVVAIRVGYFFNND